MSHRARSLYIFGIYVFVVGAAFIIVPGPLSTLLKLPMATVGWMRIVGLLALVIGTYDMISGRSESVPHIHASIWIRFGFAIGTAVLVVTKQMPPTVLLFSATDTAGALWTMLSKSPSAASGSPQT